VATVDIEQAKTYIIYLARCLYSLKHKDFDGLWSKEKKYQFHFFGVDSLNCSAISRTEYYKSTEVEDIDVMLKVLKSVYNLLYTTSYDTIYFSKGGLDLQGIQAGKGLYKIQLRESKVLEIKVITTTLKKA